MSTYKEGFQGFFRISAENLILDKRNLIIDKVCLLFGFLYYDIINKKEGVKMVNEEHIKSLEERIEKLENIFNTLVLNYKQNITLNGCEIENVVLEKCKNVIFQHNETQTAVFMGLKTSINSSAVHNLDSTKVKKCVIKNSDIHNVNRG